MNEREFMFWLAGYLNQRRTLERFEVDEILENLTNVIKRSNLK